MKAILEPNHWRLPLATALGVFSVEITPLGVSRLHFPSGGRASDRPSRNLPPAIRQWRETTSQALHARLQGLRPKKLPPFDWSGATAFQRRVWKALLEIDVGRTASYGELARRIGKPKAARAVGAACGANPIPVLVPCHRVLAANGELGGFSAGLNWKVRLLKCEGVSLH